MSDKNHRHIIAALYEQKVTQLFPTCALKSLLPPNSQVSSRLELGNEAKAFGQVK